MRTITLELLRHGPAHNQLLSPLTPYIALCENHGAVTIHVPFGHNQFLHRLDALGYALGEGGRLFQLKDTAAVLGEMLGHVPGLTAEANKRASSREVLTHLRLIISASELALLPFELALAPAGLPGAGQHLLLQSQMPICLTREVRRAPDAEHTWPDKPPRILFAAAAPPEVGDIPLEAHLLALRRAIKPWVRYYDAKNDEKREERIGEHFVFLPEATIERIEEQCASGNFTHVHVLAHGLKVEEGHDTRYALALHDARDRNKIDPVSGARLATALRASHRSGNNGLAWPTVVTLASCNAGNVGSVAGAGASIAHTLHEAGIPMVITGQFPLSFQGSVRLVEVIYEGLLWGADPRHLIYDLRRRLYSQFPPTHDWASLTAYLSLAADFEQQLSQAQINQTQRSIEVAMSYADEIIRRKSDKLKYALGIIFGPFNEGKGAKKETKQEKSEFGELQEDALARMLTTRKKLDELLLRLPKQQSNIHSLLASTAKRHSEIFFRLAIRDESKKLLRGDSRKHLVSARDHYWESFRADGTLHWVVVQFLSLSLILQHAVSSPVQRVKPQRPNSQDAQSQEASSIQHADDLTSQSVKQERVKSRPERKTRALWTLAHTLSTCDLNHSDAQTCSWAHGNLIELYMISILPEIAAFGLKQAQQRALDHACQLVEIAGKDSFEVFATRRQVLRYVDWYPNFTRDYLNDVKKIAEHIFNRFPSSGEARF